MNTKTSPAPLINELHPSGSTTAEVLMRIEPKDGLFSLDLAEVWEFRELLYFLVWRDVSVRYKQTIIGVAWAILQPVLTIKPTATHMSDIVIRTENLSKKFTIGSKNNYDTLRDQIAMGVAGFFKPRKRGAESPSPASCRK